MVRILGRRLSAPVYLYQWNRKKTCAHIVELYFLSVNAEQLCQIQMNACEIGKLSAFIVLECSNARMLTMMSYHWKECMITCVKTLNCLLIGCTSWNKQQHLGRKFPFDKIKHILCGVHFDFCRIAHEKSNGKKALKFFFVSLHADCSTNKKQTTSLNRTT